MPIFPRYGGVSTNVPYDRAVEAPSDPAPRQIQALGAGVENVAGAFHSVALKRQELEDEAEAQKRYMLAVTDMESMTEQLNVPANAMQAKDMFGKHLTEREPEWFKGLNERQQGLLQKRLFSKQLEYQVGAAKLENRAKLEDYSATMVKAQTWYADSASRRLDPDDGAATPEYKMFTDMVDKGVAVGYMTPSKGEEMKDAALKQGAYSRVYKATASDSQEEIKHVLELYKKEMSPEGKGTTFLKHLDPDKRIALKKQLDERLGSLRHSELEKIRQEKKDTKDMHDELVKSTTTLASQKLTSPEKYGALTSDWVDLAADLQLMDDKDVILFRDALEKRASSGTVTGYNNPQAFQRYAVDVYDTRSPEQASRLRDELKTDMAAGRITSTQGGIWMNHLEEKTKATADPAKSRDNNNVKDLVKLKLRTTGPMQAGKAIETSVLGEALEKLDRNEAAGYPESPWKIFDREIDGWQGRIGMPAATRSMETRRSMGLPPAGKTGDETLDAHRLKLQEQFKAAPPGPEGDALRAALREQARRLKDLQDLEKQMKALKELRDQSKAGKATQEQQSSGGGPQLGPRR